MKIPKVISPENHDVEAELDADGEYIGVCSCPACDEHYVQVGGVIECECGFQFPVDWWSQYSWGCQAGKRVAESGSPISGGMKHRCQHAYYRYGFEHPVERAWDEKDLVDWRLVMAGIEPRSMSMFGFRYANCDRCGKAKPEPRDRSSKLCVECEAETRCIHCQGGPMDEKYVCKAGIRVTDLTGTQPGWGWRRPCSYVEGGQPVACDKFTPTPIDQVIQDDNEWREWLSKFALMGPIVEAVKTEHKGKDWSGTVECPVCHGKLHLSHAAYNGHVHGQCETEACLSWME